MKENEILPVPTNVPDGRPISPTDLSQFIRLEQCERYLRLRLHERSHGVRFMRDYGVVPQSIPPLLTRSGASFEQHVEAMIRAHYPTVDLSPGAEQRHRGEHDNDRVVALAVGLTPGAVVIAFQPRLDIMLDDWHVRGDVDILRFERTVGGDLQVLIADMKSSTSAKVEHRLQVAFYREMLVRVFDAANISYSAIDIAILYRGATGEVIGLSPEEAAQQEAQRAACVCAFGGQEGLLEIVTDIDAYQASVRDLVIGANSTANRVSTTPFEELPYHLSRKCDGCLYNEFCMKQSAERDDLSLLPHLTGQDKQALHQAGVATTRMLATLKEPDVGGRDLVSAPGAEALVRKLATTWPISAHLDELVYRARRYRAWKGDKLSYLPYIPSKGYGSLPYSDAEHNPNLVRVYIDAQHDYLHDRIYLLSALVVGCEHGIESPTRRRSIVCMTSEAPSQPEQEAELFLTWIDQTLRAVIEVAAPDADGQARAPIHLIFWDSFEQRILLDGLQRHFATIFAVTPLYDFMTQIAAFDSPIISFLEQEIRTLKNYPMVCQSLQAVAAYLRFEWNEPQPYRDIFRTRLFDFWGKLDQHQDTPELTPWYTNRARFNSQVPLEYAYAAWNELPATTDGETDDFAAYRTATPALLQGFYHRRLEALEHIAHDFAGNRQTLKTTFTLPDLATFNGRARTLAHALEEFTTIERHTTLESWKTIRLQPPERRVLIGETLLTRYIEAEQEGDVADRNRENERRRLLNEQYRAEYKLANPNAKQVRLSKEQKAASDWTQDDLMVRLRLETAALDCDLDEALAQTTLRVGDRVVIAPRTTVDERLPSEERVPFTPTPKQLLYASRGDIRAIVVERDAAGRSNSGYIEIALQGRRGGTSAGGYTFSGRPEPLLPDQVYTLDADPNDYYGLWCSKVVQGLVASEGDQSAAHNTLYDHLVGRPTADVDWPAAAAAAQAYFLEGLDALHTAGALHDFEPSKRDYIARHGDAPILLVQGPPGTGKSYGTAFALFARLQGALAAGLPFRIFISCKTHAATDVLLRNVQVVQQQLRKLAQEQPTIFMRFFDPRLLDAPLFRVRGRQAPPDGVIALHKPDERTPGEHDNITELTPHPWCIVAATPGGIYGMLNESKSGIYGHEICDCLVLDEASQMNLPEAAMAALPLRAAGSIIVVGDHRQMPPIVQHDWRTEARRTFQIYRAYESLFLTLLPLNPPMIKFSESFRLHADMAAFLRDEIYAQDGIAYHSQRYDILEPPTTAADLDPFVRAVLTPEQTIVVVVHDEASSQVRNPFEQTLIAPILTTLANPDLYGLGPEQGLGVVVPHRAQRSAMQEALPHLTLVDPQTGAVTRSSIDTVERFQGGERTAIMVSATESERGYLLASGDFLLDPRRLTVALSRAKRKMMLVAARSVFELFSADEVTFANSQLWKNLLRRTCTVKLWEGERDGVHVEVWGNHSN